MAEAPRKRRSLFETSAEKSQDCTSAVSSSRSPPENLEAKIYKACTVSDISEAEKAKVEALKKEMHEYIQAIEDLDQMNTPEKQSESYVHLKKRYNSIKTSQEHQEFMKSLVDVDEFVKISKKLDDKIFVMKVHLEDIKKKSEEVVERILKSK